MKKLLVVVGAGWGVVVFVAALITDLNMLVKPPPPEFPLDPGVLGRRELSWFELLLLLLPVNKLSIVPLITAAAPINDDPINPAVAVIGRSNCASNDAIYMLARRNTTTITENENKIN